MGCTPLNVKENPAFEPPETVTVLPADVSKCVRDCKHMRPSSLVVVCCIHPVRVIPPTCIANSRVLVVNHSTLHGKPALVRIYRCVKGGLESSECGKGLIIGWVAGNGPSYNYNGSSARTTGKCISYQQDGQHLDWILAAWYGHRSL